MNAPDTYLFELHTRNTHNIYSALDEAIAARNKRDGIAITDEQRWRHVCYMKRSEDSGFFVYRDEACVEIEDGKPRALALPVHTCATAFEATVRKFLVEDTIRQSRAIAEGFKKFFEPGEMTRPNSPTYFPDNPCNTQSLS